MALVARLVHMGFTTVIGSRLSTIVAIIIAAVVYFILLLTIGLLTYEDFKLLPNGDKIANKLVRFKLLKR